MAYDDRPDQAWPSIRLGSPVSGPSSVALPVAGGDGDYGNETVNAVMAFQEDHDLLMDGSVGQESRGVLNALLNTDRYTAPDGHPGWGNPLG